MANEATSEPPTLRARYEKVRSTVKNSVQKALQSGSKPNEISSIRKGAFISAEEKQEEVEKVQKEKTAETERANEADRQARDRQQELEDTREELVLEQVRKAEVEEDREKYKKLSLTDELTGIPNRRAFNDELGRVLSSAERYGEEFALLYIDLDSMKQINDKYGHDAGDTYLKNATKILQEALRQSDILGRLGGDEFGVILPKTSQIVAGVIAERIRAAFETRFLALMSQSIQGETSPLTVSIGYTTYPYLDQERKIPGRNKKELLIEADSALYASKKPNNGDKGKNRVTHFGGGVISEFKTTVSEPEEH